MNVRAVGRVPRWLSVVAPFVLASLAVSIAVGPSTDVASRPLRPPPSTGGTDLLSRQVTLGSLRGKPVVVIFFASWCAPCHEDARIFTELAGRYRDEVRFISIAVSDDRQDARAFATRYGWTWPTVLDDGHRWVGAFGPPGVPTTFVIDPGGAVIKTLNGPVTSAQVDAVLDPLLRSSDRFPSTG